jgi:hypothetical protein
VRDVTYNEWAGKRVAHVVFEIRAPFSLIGLLGAIDGGLVVWWLVVTEIP